MGLPAVTSHVGKAQTSTHQAQLSQNLSKKAKANYHTSQDCVIIKSWKASRRIAGVSGSQIGLHKWFDQYCASPVATFLHYVYFVFCSIY
jgi:hypothetical protein